MVAIQQRLLVKFSCDLYNNIHLWDLLLVSLLVFVTSGCYNIILLEHMKRHKYIGYSGKLWYHRLGVKCYNSKPLEQINRKNLVLGLT